MLTRDAFIGTYVGLLATLWSELEALFTAIESVDQDECDDDLNTHAEAVLLELALLRERCDATSMRRLLTVHDRLLVQSLLDDVSELLELKPFELPTLASLRAIVLTQNRIFDEIYKLSVDSGDAATETPLSDDQALATLEHRYYPLSRSDGPQLMHSSSR